MFDHGDYKVAEQSAVDALTNVGLSGAGATLVAVLRPKLDKLLDPVRVYLETGASFPTSVVRPALEVVVVSAGVFLGLLGATNVAASAFPKTYAKAYFDGPALERILAGVHCPGTAGALDVNAILAASEKVPLTIATKGLISLDLRQEPDPDRLAAAIDRLSGELAATPPVSHAQLVAMHGKLTSIAGSLDRIKEHVSALAPHGVSQEP